MTPTTDAVDEGALRFAARGLVAVYVALLAAQDALAVLGLLSLGPTAGEAGWLALWVGRALVEAALAVGLARARPRAGRWAAAWLALSMALHVLAALRNPLGFRTGRLATHAAALLLLALVGRRGAATAGR